MAATVLIRIRRREQIEFVLVREDIPSRMSHLRFRCCTCTVNPEMFAYVSVCTEQIRIWRVLYDREDAWENDVLFDRTLPDFISFWKINLYLSFCFRLEAECPWVREGGRRLNGHQPPLFRSRASPQKSGKCSGISFPIDIKKRY